MINGHDYSDEDATYSGEDVASAYHEAGHSVAIIHGGFEFLSSGVSIRGGSGLTHWTSGDIEQRAVKAGAVQARFDVLTPKLIVDFAGGYAEAQRTGNGGAANAGIKNDMKLAGESFTRVIGSTSPSRRNTLMQQAMTKANAMLDENWTAVAAIAKALLSRKTISGQEARALYVAAENLRQLRIVDAALPPDISPAPKSTPVLRGQTSLGRWLRRICGRGSRSH